MNMFNLANQAKRKTNRTVKVALLSYAIKV